MHGRQVTEGSGRMLMLAVGERSEWGLHHSHGSQRAVLFLPKSRMPSSSCRNSPGNADERDTWCRAPGDGGQRAHADACGGRAQRVGAAP